MKALTFVLVVTLLILNWALTAVGDVVHRQINEENFITLVNNDPWQPEGFDEALILRAASVEAGPAIDGKADDPAWSKAESLTVPMAYGAVREATLKAVYTKEEIFLLVSWPDATEDDRHHPWVWSEERGRYEEGPQAEDSLLVSFEAGCEWTPSLLSGYVYDFDGWLWLAARSNPIGQAVDTAGHVQDRWIPNRGYTRYKSRNAKPSWTLKFTDHRPGILTTPWQELDRAYLLQPVAREVYVSYNHDGFRPPMDEPVFVVKQPPPEVDFDSEKGSSILGPRPAHASLALPSMVPQFKPVKLTGDAGEITAKGRWADGRWTVEFRRSLVTPARTATDAIFERVTQFSIHIFDHTERVDEASESGRLFLQFEPLKESEEK